MPPETLYNMSITLSNFLGLWLSILWSLVAVFGRTKILLVTAFGASEKTGPLQSTIFVAFEMLRLLRSQETANTVFAVLQRLRMLGAFGK